MNDPLPNFLIIGAQKAGTASLWNYLREHPDVFVATPRELHFFNRRFNQGVHAYRAKFADAEGYRAIGECTPDYVYDRDAVVRIAATVSDAKLVLLLRHPVDRAYSAYWMERRKRRETLDFEDALVAEPERLRDRQNGNYAYVDRGRYMVQIEHLLRHFGSNQLLVHLFEDLADHPLVTYQSVCRFLEIDHTLIPKTLGTVYNKGQRRWTRLHRASRKLRRKGWPHLAAGVGRITPRLPYPPMKQETRVGLLRTFEGDTRRLAEWLQRDLSAWNN